MPLWFGHVNKRIFNPSEIRKGKRPVIAHVGRRSGRSYQTPLDVHRCDDGTVIMFLVYGSKCDWVQNVRAAGRATITIDDKQLAATSPRIVDRDTAASLVPADVSMPPRILNVTEFLQMDVAPEG